MMGWSKGHLTDSNCGYYGYMSGSLWSAGDTILNWMQISVTFTCDQNWIHFTFLFQNIVPFFEMFCGNIFTYLHKKIRIRCTSLNSQPQACTSSVDYGHKGINIAFVTMIKPHETLLQIWTLQKILINKHWWQWKEKLKREHKNKDYK